MTLGELILKRQRDLGLSLEKMARRARASGYSLTRATLSQLSAHPVDEAPKRRTLEAVAIACDVPYPDVVMATATSLLGDAARLVDADEQLHVRSWVTLTRGRSESEIDSLLRVVRSATDILDIPHRGESRPDGATHR